MAKLYKEDQRITRPELYLLLGLFSLLLSKEWIYFFLNGDPNPGLPVLLSLTVLFGLIWWFILNLKMRIRIGKHLITLKYQPVIRRKHIINIDRVDSFKFYKIPESSLWSGWGVRFFSGKYYFSLGDNAGLYIRMKDGKEYVISSSKLLSERQAIEKRLNKKSEKSDYKPLYEGHSTTHSGLKVFL